MLDEAIRIQKRGIKKYPIGYRLQSYIVFCKQPQII